MDSDDNNQSIVGGPEHGGTGTTKEPGMKRRRHESSDNTDIQQQIGSSADENSSNLAAQLRQMQEKLASLGAEMEAVKSEKNLLAEKNNLLTGKLEILEQKLKVAELETKMVKAETQNLIAEKVNEATGLFREQLSKLEAKMEEKDQKFEQLEKLAKQIDHGMADFGGKMANLESQTAEGQNKLENTRKTLEELNLNMWSNNRWHMQVGANGLTATKTIANGQYVNFRAVQPISRTIFASLSGMKLVYFEVQLMKSRASVIGWIGHNFPLNSAYWIGGVPGVYGISYSGDYWEPGSKIAGYGTGFGEGDVVGSGFTRDGRLFFTLNGQLNGKPIVLKDNQELLIYPAVSFIRINASVEANFGADPTRKPFKFDINAHEAQLFQ